MAVTGYDQANHASQARSAGFDHHLVKPVRPEVLSPLVKAMLDDRSASIH